MPEIVMLIKRVFSLDLLIYAAIVVLFVLSSLKCVLPLALRAGKLRKASRIIIRENKQKLEKKSWKDINFLGTGLQGLWVDFLQNAEMRAAHGESCDVAQYVNEESVIYSIRGFRLSELTPGLLTSLGRLGTFLGLVNGLSGLSISAADTAALLSAMEKLIGGMSTAFLTSIAGVTGSMLFNLLHNHYMTGAQKAIDRFCDVFGLYALPKPVSEDTALISLQREQTAYLRKAVDEIGQKMAGQMEESILRGMLPIQRSMDNFVLAATQAQVEGMDRIAQVFVQRMNVALGQEFEHLRAVMASAGNQQIAAQQELQSAIQAMDQMTRDVINLHQMSQGLLEHFRSYVDAMNDSREQTEALGQKNAELLVALQQSCAQQGQHLARLQDYQAALSQTGQQYSMMLDRYLAETQSCAQSAARSMNEASRQMGENALAMQNAYRVFAKDSMDHLSQTTAMLDESVNASIRRMNETMTAMNEVARTLPQLMSQSRERYAGQIDLFVEALTKLQKHMDGLNESLAALKKTEE